MGVSGGVCTSGGPAPLISKGTSNSDRNLIMTYMQNYGGGNITVITDLSLAPEYTLTIIGIATQIVVGTVLPALRANSCIDFDRLMIELLDFHIPFLSFTNAGFKGYGKNLLNRRLRITLLP